MLSIINPEKVAEQLAVRCRELRLANQWKRETLAARSGVTHASLKRFENSGKGSLETVLKIAYALGRLNDFNEILKPHEAQTISELEAGQVKQQRGRR